MSMNPYAIGLVAGLTATVVVSMLMIINSAVGIVPGVDVISLLAGLGHAYLGLAPSPALGWALHFLIGTVLWGLSFTFLRSSLPGGGDVANGIIFSIGVWVLLMLIAMPLMAADWIVLNVGMAAPVATLLLHLIFGAVLGTTHARLWADAVMPARSSTAH